MKNPQPLWHSSKSKKPPLEGQRIPECIYDEKLPGKTEHFTLEIFHSDFAFQSEFSACRWFNPNTLAENYRSHVNKHNACVNKQVRSQESHEHPVSYYIILIKYYVETAIM